MNCRYGTADYLFFFRRYLIFYIVIHRVVGVRELMGWVHNVVLIDVYLDLGNPGGSGFWVEGYMSQVREMGKLVYKQPGNEVDGSCHN
jgi:hypothetical protein